MDVRPSGHLLQQAGFDIDDEAVDIDISGNELAWGIVFFAWLLGVALGAVCVLALSQDASAVGNAGLVGWWRFEGDTLDSSNLGNDGTSIVGDDGDVSYAGSAPIPDIWISRATP